MLLSVVFTYVIHHDTRRQHNVGVGGGRGGAIKKNNWSTLKSKTNKKLGIGSPVFWIFFAHYTVLFKNMGKTEVRGKGGCDALAH